MPRLPARSFSDALPSLSPARPRLGWAAGRTFAGSVARASGAASETPAHRSIGPVVDSLQALGLTRLRSCLLSAVAFSAGIFVTSPVLAADSCPPLLKHSFPSLQDQKPQSLCQWQGKVLLVVNTASYCGFTSQYDGLEKLYARLKERGLVVVGFPSNDFGNQEPGSNKEIAEFCRLTYGVQFPMFAKATVVGRNASPLYLQLTRATGEAPQWNFHKYLIDRSGTRVLSFGSRVRPDDRELLARIDEFLGK
ncbi:MAG: glutathione peroxidase [Candidatus Accumulibacter cognatus]|uniref:Glutathione peroxidase n=1 Tax=Candidatus Accumulibacter cognatus TaxID=2954383 RepID=A0A7D5SA87_9PROT|nr:MAG: glutathione peroxidase [Candidatus Accumulibacter cognatus]